MAKHKPFSRGVETGAPKYRPVRQLPTPAKLNKHIRDTNPALASLLGIVKPAEVKK